TSFTISTRSSCMRSRSFALFALGAACALIVGGSTAYATNGASLLIGRTNAATAPTALSNPSGTPLVLSGRADAAPLKISNTVRVGNLNADLVDGIDGNALALKAGRT